MTITYKPNTTISRDNPQIAEPKIPKLELVNPEKIQDIMNPQPSFPPKPVEEARMQARLGGTRP